MQIVIAIPHDEELQSNGGAERLLYSEFAEFPYLSELSRLLCARARTSAGDSPGGIAAEVEKTLRASRILGALRELRFVEALSFDPASTTSWSDILEFVETNSCGSPGIGSRTSSTSLA